MEINIKIIKSKGKRKAIVTYNKKAHSERSSGLIQYLANFCEEIEYKLKDKKE